MVTHYTPALFSRRHPIQQALCGLYVRKDEVAFDPSCPKCAVEVEALRREEDKIAGEILRHF